MSNHIAIYPGTFDPITNAHIDLVERGLRFFDKVILAIASNPSKKPLFEAQERIELARIALADITRTEVENFDGLLVDYVKNKKSHMIIRGLRAVSDFEYEFQMALMNRKLAPEIETIFLMPSESYTFLSSHLVKEICMLGGDISGLVPSNVEKALKIKFNYKNR